MFAALPEPQLKILQLSMQQRSYPRGAFILRAGEETDGLYILIAGRVKVLIPDEQGREVILTTLGIGEFFGEMGLLDNQPRSASVETLEPCQVLRLTRAAFIGVLKDNFDLTITVMQGLVKRLRGADRSIESLALVDVYGRVARVLLDHSEEVNGEWIVRQSPPKQEIARMIGASREMVSRVVKDLQIRGYIKAEKRRIHILDKLALLARAGG